MSSTAAHRVVEKLLQNSLDPAIVREIVPLMQHICHLPTKTLELKKIRQQDMGDRGFEGIILSGKMRQFFVV
jgi:hypothetical protein